VRSNAGYGFTGVCGYGGVSNVALARGGSVDCVSTARGASPVGFAGSGAGAGERSAVCGDGIGWDGVGCVVTVDSCARGSLAAGACAADGGGGVAGR
jgi:hypothetical protein